MLKIVWVRIIFVFLFVWLITSIYFYTQHEITIWTYQVNQQVDLNNVKIDIEEISVRNYKRNERFANNNLIYKTASKLPHQLQLGFLNICYFYGLPYNINNKYGVMSVKGRLISNNFISDERNIEVEVVDDIGVHYARSNRRSHESDSDIANFKTEGDYFPFEKLGSTLKISIKDKREDKPIEIIVNPNFTKQTYGYFHKKPTEY